MLHLVIVIFGVVLALSLCGVVGTVLWMVVRRGQTLMAHDLIPLVGFTLSGLVSFLIFTISTTVSSTPQKKPPTGPAPHSLMTSPTPTATATPTPPPAATATPTRAPAATAPASATASPSPTATATATPPPAATATPTPPPAATATPTR